MQFIKEINNIYRLKVPFDTLYTSVFLIKDNSDFILIDCATTKSDVDQIIVPALGSLSITLNDLKCVLVTHIHSDHSGGLQRIKELCPSINVITNLTPLTESLEIYNLSGHTNGCIGVLDIKSGTLISGDGLQGYGVDKYRCSVESVQEYLNTIDRIKNDNRIQNILFSHAYEPWYKDGAFGREQVEKCLKDCSDYIENNLK